MLKHWENMLSGTNDRNPKLYNKLTSIFRAGYNAPIYEKLLECEDEQACFLMERFMIQTIGRNLLCNLTNGGDGPSGAVLSKEHRKKIGDAIRGAVRSEETRRKIGDANLGKIHREEARQKMREARLGKTASEETRQRMSEAMRGEKHPMFGKHHNKEARIKIREARARQTIIHSAETCQKIREAMQGRIFSEETLQKMRESALKRQAKARLTVA